MLQAKTNVDTTGLKSLIKKLDNLEDWDGEAGFDDRIHPKHDVPMSEIAEVNEYGDSDKNTPSRPFMRTAADQSQVAIQRMFIKQYGLFIRGKTTSRNMMSKLAQEESEWIADVIRNNSFHKNAALTIALKGGTQPLVNSGYMADHVNSKAVKTTGG